MAVGVLSIGSYVPSRCVSNDELAQTLDTSDEWIRSHTGIGSRYIASERETVAFMASEAAKSAVVNAGLAKEDIDFIIVSSITPDYRDFPATANLVQRDLSIGQVGSLDLKAACTGFVYGLEVGRGLVLGKTAKCVLLIGAEKLSAIVNWKDRSTAVLFGDGAGAVILGEVESDSGIQDSILRTDGSGAEYLFMSVGGTATPYDSDMPFEEQGYLKMDGQKVYSFAVRVNTEVVRDLMKRNNLQPDDIDYIVPHQANYRIIAAAAKRSKIPMEKYYLNIEKFANTSSASIPLALAEMEDKGLLRRGMRILTVGFGSGLTYGGNYIIW